MIPGFVAGGMAGGAPIPLDDAIMADSPWAYYQLGEAASPTPTSYADSSGNSRALSNIVATITAGSAQLCPPGTSVDFNGSGYISSTNNQYGTAQATAFNGDKAFTIATVADLDSLAGDPVILHLGNASVNGSQGLFAQALSTGAVRLQFYDTTSAGYKSITSAAGVVTAGTPFIIHCRRAVGGACKIAIAGSSVATGTLTGTIAMAATSGSGGQRIMLGALNAATPSNKINGRQQHAAIFAAALSDARIAAHAAASGL